MRATRTAGEGPRAAGIAGEREWRREPESRGPASGASGDARQASRRGAADESLCIRPNRREEAAAPAADDPVFAEERPHEEAAAPRPLHRPAAVVFDMDGLMLDTEPLAARAWTEAARTLGVAFDHAVTERMIGRNFGDCRAIVRAHHGDGYPVDALMSEWHAAYDALVAREGIALKPGLLELLAWLEEQDVPRAVATSTRRARAQAKLEHTRLAGRFAALVGGDEIPRGKPEPDIYLEAASRLGLAPGACVALEDSEPGIHAALAAGMMPIMVPDLSRPSAALLARAPLVLASLVEVLEHLAALPRREQPARDDSR